MATAAKTLQCYPMLDATIGLLPILLQIKFLFLVETNKLWIFRKVMLTLILVKKLLLLKIKAVKP